MTARGTLWGVGLGPGDPELVTVKAARVIGEADVVAYHSARHGRSIARGIAEPYLRPGQIEEHLVYPVTTETTDHPGGYAGAIEDFYVEASARIAAHLDAGRTVALLAEGDPLFYSSYMHLHTRLTQRFDAVIVPGVTSVSAASAAVATPLVAGDEVLSVLPGTLPVAELTRRLADADAAVVLKLGRSYHAVREALSSSGRLDDAFYVERASTPAQRILPAAEVDETSVPYFSLAMLPGGRRLRQQSTVKAGAVVVVGLGPGDTDWTTPQSRRELAAATDLIGYAGYLDRVPDREGQRRHASDNTDEAARAQLACSLAEQGRAVAVVSSGDPGVFAMATAVLEEAKQWPGVQVRVIPGMTAAQAVASRVGAPLGHDYAVISLSDRLKPWDVIASRLDAAAAADLVLAIYNPASKSRTWQVGAMRDVLLAHREPGTPVVIGRDVAGPAEDVRVVRLDELDPAEIDMRCLLIVGSSQTQWHSSDFGDRVFTPRRYPA
ncbi:cobI [Mycobacterium rhizamassiliense]|jgi:precorrin-2 C20-methyltransferase/precorrin-3B C17-methyltransferase|uniref:CobI n=1 Tax=Mycobacterium rhizamassiliense TaxID=1841860 RepID=A0A2U3NXZ8_9MYCO|nr:precorrin-2 C(20)-methyltransferase [Mycobacterium rhizamassiliense]SPM36397.1 cobI [Mycobacterium rhizamassiliense]